MRGPKPQAIELTDTERRGLAAVARRHTTPQQVALRARSSLAAADGHNDAQIARELAVGVETARRWRGRWRDLRGIALADLSRERRLADAPRSGAPVRIGAEQVCRIVALACAAPAATGRPISQRTDREIADEVIKRGIAAALAPRHAGRLRNRGMCRPIVAATG